MARPLPLSLPLFHEEPPPRKTEAPVTRVRPIPKQLWMAVHFPRLALEALRVSPTSREQVAVIDGHGQKAVVWDCTKGAARCGVQPGQLFNSALALAPQLKTLNRDVPSEQGALVRLAELGHNFTPTVSLENPNGLLLEVEGSAHLFGGTLGILASARQMFGKEGFMPAVALAPTPVAALWLAQARLEIPVINRDELRSILGKLPVAAIRWPKGTTEAFRRLGIEYMADVLRLPRDGLAKRFGKEFLQTLDRALGRRPDPRSSWQAARHCKFTRDLPGELTQMSHMQPYVDSMIDELADDLRSHDAAVNRVKLLFRHWHQSSTSVVVGSAAPYREAKLWKELVHGRLASLTLPSPVHEIQLISGRFMLYSATTMDMLGTRTEYGDSIQRLIDLLRARMGQAAVFGMAMTADARPEKATRVIEPGERVLEMEAKEPRPINVLAAPMPLACSEDQPRYRGATLSLIDGPERIEGGWWAQERWRRDYYEALSTRGERLWIFHEGKQWFLHGLYS